MKPSALPYAVATVTNSDRLPAVWSSFHQLVGCVCGGALETCPAVNRRAA